MGAAPEGMIYNSVRGKFVAVFTGGTVGESSDDAVAWATPAVTGLDVPAAGVGSIAWASSGATIICGMDSGVCSFSAATNGAVTTWALTGGTVPGAIDQGFIAGSGLSSVYHLARLGASTLAISSSTNGITWTPVSSLATATLAGTQCRLLICPNTQLFVIAAPLASGVTALYASNDLGVTWSAVRHVSNIPIGAFAIAGGRLFATKDDMLLAASGYHA
jgi:hypothetical protein